MEQGQKVPRLDVFLKLLGFFCRQGPVLVPSGQVAHAGLVELIKANGEKVSGQLTGEVAVIDLEKTGEYREFARGSTGDLSCRHSLALKASGSSVYHFEGMRTRLVVQT